MCGSGKKGCARMLRWLLTGALAALVCCGGMAVDVHADETDPVTITYEDGETESWDGTTPLTIEQSCTITVNADLAQKGAKVAPVTIGKAKGSTPVTVTIEGNGHTITGDTLANYSLINNADVTMRNVTIDAATITLSKDAQLTITDSHLVSTHLSNGSNQLLYLKEANTVTVNGNSTLTLYNKDSIKLQNADATFNLESGSITLLNGNSSTGNKAPVWSAIVNNKGTVNISGGTIAAEVNKGVAISTAGGGTVNITGGTLKAWDYVVKLTKTEDTLNLSDGELINTSSYNGTTMHEIVSGGTVNMTGGTLTGNGKGAYALVHTKDTTITVTGGTIQNCQYGININGNPGEDIKIGGDITWDVTYASLYLANKSYKFTALDSLSNELTVFGNNARNNMLYNGRAITTDGTAEDLYEKIRFLNDGWLTRYDSENKNIYIYQHTHEWTYNVDNENGKITVTCTSSDDGSSYCPYTEAQQEEEGTEIAWTLEATDADWDGDAYAGASASAPTVTIEGSAWPEGQLTYEGDEGTEYAESETAPTEPGDYIVYYSFTANGQTYRLSRQFKIRKVTPQYEDELPTDLKATEGQTLADITLPEGFSWEDSEQSVGEAGTHTYKAIYTPSDTTHYNTVEDIEITVTVEKADPQPEPEPEPKPDPGPDPTPGPDPKPDPQPTPDPDPRPDPQPTPTPDPQPTPIPTPTPAAGTTTTKKAAAQPQPCHHVYEWEVYQKATATTDGIMRYRCKYCGTVDYEVPITAYYTFNKETQEAIQKAAVGATVRVETPIFVSFHEMVKDALVARPDVTLVVTYRYEGTTYEMTIPAGSADQLETLYGENTYAGFRYLGTVFSTVDKALLLAANQ